jgi:hypothetical protein
MRRQGSPGGTAPAATSSGRPSADTANGALVTLGSLLAPRPRAEATAAVGGRAATAASSSASPAASRRCLISDSFRKPSASAGPVTVWTAAARKRRPYRGRMDGSCPQAASIQSVRGRYLPCAARPADARAHDRRRAATPARPLVPGLWRRGPAPGAGGSKLDGKVRQHGKTVIARLRHVPSLSAAAIWRSRLVPSTYFGGRYA